MFQRILLIPRNSKLLSGGPVIWLSSRVWGLFCIVVLFSLTGCFRQRPEDVFANSHYIYERAEIRYSLVRDSLSDQELLENIRLIAGDRSLSFGSGLWESLCGNEYLVTSQGAPLHKALYFIERDSAELEGTLAQLERFGYFNRPIYQKIQGLRLTLLKIARFIRAQKEFSTEAQYIEDRRVQKAQLAEQTEQTRLLRNLQDSNSKKQVKVDELHIHL